MGKGSKKRGGGGGKGKHHKGSGGGKSGRQKDDSPVVAKKKVTGSAFPMPVSQYNYPTWYLNFTNSSPLFPQGSDEFRKHVLLQLRDAGIQNWGMG